MVSQSQAESDAAALEQLSDFLESSREAEALEVSFAIAFDAYLGLSG